MAAADERLDLFEWSLRKVIDHDLGQRFSPKHRLHGRASVRMLAPECRTILGALAHFGQGDADPNPSYQAGFSSLGLNEVGTMPLPNDCGITQIDQAVSKLQRLSPQAKRIMLHACAQTIAHDHFVTDVEAQVLRGVAAGLSCPLPPSLQPVAN